MAKVINKLPQVKRGRPELYPYKQWFNCKAWELKHGVDFTVDPASFKAALYAAKTRMGYTITTRTTVDANGVTTVSVQRLTGAVAKNHKPRGRKPAAKVA